MSSETNYDIYREYALKKGIPEDKVDDFVSAMIMLIVTF